MWLTDSQAGAGKTVITTSVIDHVLKTLGRSTDTGISYFMNDFSSRESLEVRTILRCLSRQLLVTLDPIPKAIVDMLETDIALLKTSQTLLYVVDRVIRLHKTVFIILDGIDEMPDGGRLELLEILDKLIGECPRRVKVFISSRRRYSTSQLAIPRDATEISLNPQLSMAAAGLVNDIRHYVQNEMEVLIRRGRLTIKAPNLKQEIEDTLVAKSDGMYA